MIQILVTFVPSLFWILYRCYQTLRTPVEEIIQDLSIEIPHRPNICIDSVTETSVIIHWDIERSNDDNLYYVIVINGKEVATVQSTSCKLNNFEPHQVYQIEVIVINSVTHFQSQSESVFIETFDKQDPKFRFVKDLDDIQPDAFDSNSSTVKNKSKSKTKLNEDSEQFETNAMVDDLTVEKIQTITNPETVLAYLTILQNEVVKTNLEHKHQQALFIKEFDTLQEEYQLYKREYDEETDNKTKKDSDVRSLERSKDKLTFQKSKLINQLNSLNGSLDLLQKRLDDYQDKIHRLQDRNNHSLSNEANEIANINKEISTNLATIETIKFENDSIDEQIKILQTEKRELTNLINHIKPLIEIINSPLPEDPVVPLSTTMQASASTNNISHVNPIIANTVSNTSNSNPTSSSPSPAPASTISNNSVFNKDGSINKIVLETLQKLFVIVPEWENEIIKEVTSYQELEVGWKESFQLAIKKYVSMHQSLQIARQNKDKTYQPIKITEYQASVDFGGYSNALFKSKFGTGKRSFTPPSSSFDDNSGNNSHNNSMIQIQQPSQQLQGQIPLVDTSNLINGNDNGGNSAYNSLNPNTNTLNNFYNHYSQVYTPEIEGNNINPMDQIQGLDQYGNVLDPYQQQQQPFQVLEPAISSPQLLLDNQLGMDPYTPFDTIVNNSTNNYQSPALAQAPLIQVDNSNQLYNQGNIGGYDNSSLVSLLQQQSTSQLSTNNTQPPPQPQQSLGFPYDDSIYTTSIQSPLVETTPTYGYNPTTSSAGSNVLYNYNSPILNRQTLTGTPINTGGSTNSTNNSLWSSTTTNNNLQIFGNNPTTNDEFMFNNSNGNGGAGASNVVGNSAGGNDLNGGGAGASAGGAFFMTPTSSHTRNVSNNSQIWKIDNNNTLSNHNFNLGGVFGSSNLNLHIPSNLTTSSGSTVNNQAQQQQQQQTQQQLANTPPVANASLNPNSVGSSNLYGNHTPTTTHSNVTYNFGQQL
ncbi:hypothetical protein DFJ63DRAFT_312375 [Scheffersomyces coipomensis]|uniref:uncharacterized protein n=1 Tax=Scheffersomyces coipomensis TaxID=1788519 RepID=UPI00315DAE6D